MSTANVARLISFPLPRQTQERDQTGARLLSMRGPRALQSDESVSHESHREERAFAFREAAELKDKLAQEKLYLEQEIRSAMNFDQIVGDSPALRHVLELVDTVASSS